MAKIKILENNLIDKIAAGEIIDRPSSVVKELIENSLDAHATSIEVEVAAGGLEKILVKDDGDGMEREDLILAFERHATSKISTEEDLFSLVTLGFRGEAIPSIASVSIMILRSGIGFDRPGHEVRAKGGRITKVSEIQPCKGTAAEINSIFFNTPARKKFMRSSATELSHIVDSVQSFALCFHNIRFSLKTEKRDILMFPPVQKKIDRIVQMYGTTFLKNLVPFSASYESINIEGYVTDLKESRKNRSGQYLFINGRSIRDRILSSATLNAYREYFQGAHPYLFLFIHIDPSYADFNVHPSKLEVRFRDQRDVYRKVRETIRAAFVGSKSVTRDEFATFKGERDLMPVQNRKPAAPSFSSVESATLPPLQVDVREKDMKAGYDEWNIIGQHRDTYILASRNDDLFLIDQHIAHERVLFEDFFEIALSTSIERQRLMFPLTVEMPPSEAQWIQVNKEILSKIGLIIESFGPTTIKIEEIPSHMRIDSAVDLVREIGSSQDESIREEREELKRLISSLACHSAVKAGERLPGAKMEFIVEALFRCTNPHFCPHGRPIFMRIQSDVISKHFRRKS